MLTTVMSGLDPHTAMKTNLVKQLIGLKEMAPGYESSHWLWLNTIFKASYLRFYSTVKEINKKKPHKSPVLHLSSQSFVTELYSDKKDSPCDMI